jgi:F-type H+-transporting ATPase subunit delta
MLKESIARRYTAALYALAQERGQAPAVAADLDAFVGALKSDPTLTDFFASPVIERELKTRIVRDALSGRSTELTVQFLILLVRKRRELLLEIVARQMHELLDEAAGREQAEVASPLPLSPPQLAELARRLSRIYGRTIVPDEKVEPELLGGLIVQVGDRYVDASVAGKLEELRRHLLASADAWGPTSTNGKGKPA